MVRRSSLALLASLSLGAPALAVEPCAPVPELGLTEIDAGRLGALAASREKGIAAARAGGGPEAAATLDGLFEQGLTPATDLPEGDYQCRTIKLGGPFGAFTPYSFFACTVSEGPDGKVLEKRTGSQRFFGLLIEVGGGLVFRGADHYGDETPKAYDDDPERNAVGCVSRVSPDGGSYILEFPQPFLESDHDVIELRPR